MIAADCRGGVEVIDEYGKSASVVGWYHYPEYIRIAYSERSHRVAWIGELRTRCPRLVPSE